MSEATFLPGARADLLEALGHYREQSSPVAQRLRVAKGQDLLAKARQRLPFVYSTP